MMIYNCAGKLLVRQNSTLVDSYVHLNKCVCWSVHFIKGRLTWYSIHVFIQGIMVITNTCTHVIENEEYAEIKCFRLTIKFNYYV